MFEEQELNLQEIQRIRESARQIQLDNLEIEHDVIHEEEEYTDEDEGDYSDDYEDEPIRKEAEGELDLGEIGGEGEKLDEQANEDQGEVTQAELGLELGTMDMKEAQENQDQDGEGNGEEDNQVDNVSDQDEQQDIAPPTARRKIPVRGNIRGRVRPRGRGGMARGRGRPARPIRKPMSRPVRRVEPEEKPEEVVTTNGNDILIGEEKNDDSNNGSFEKVGDSNPEEKNQGDDLEKETPEIDGGVEATQDDNNNEPETREPEGNNGQEEEPELEERLKPRTTSKRIIPKMPSRGARRGRGPQRRPGRGRMSHNIARPGRGRPAPRRSVPMRMNPESQEESNDILEKEEQSKPVTQDDNEELPEQELQTEQEPVANNSPQEVEQEEDNLEVTPKKTTPPVILEDRVISQENSEIKENEGDSNENVSTEKKKLPDLPARRAPPRPSRGRGGPYRKMPRATARKVAPRPQVSKIEEEEDALELLPSSEPQIDQAVDQAPEDEPEQETMELELGESDQNGTGLREGGMTLEGGMSLGGGMDLGMSSSLMQNTLVDEPLEQDRVRPEALQKEQSINNRAPLPVTPSAEENLTESDNMDEVFDQQINNLVSTVEERNNLIEENQSANTRIGELQEIIQSKDLEIEDLKSQIIELQSQQQTTVAELEQHAKDLDSAKRTLEEQENLHANKIQELTNANDLLMEKNNENLQEITSLESTISNLQGQLSSVEDNMSQPLDFSTFDETLSTIEGFLIQQDPPAKVPSQLDLRKIEKLLKTPVSTSGASINNYTPEIRNKDEKINSIGKKTQRLVQVERVNPTQEIDSLNVDQIQEDITENLQSTLEAIPDSLEGANPDFSQFEGLNKEEEEDERLNAKFTNRNKILFDSYQKQIDQLDNQRPNTNEDSQQEDQEPSKNFTNRNQIIFDSYQKQIDEPDRQNMGLGEIEKFDIGEVEEFQEEDIQIPERNQLANQHENQPEPKKVHVRKKSNPFSKSRSKNKPKPVIKQIKETKIENVGYEENGELEQEIQETVEEVQPEINENLNEVQEPTYDQQENPKREEVDEESKEKQLNIEHNETPNKDDRELPQIEQSISDSKYDQKAAQSENEGQKSDQNSIQMIPNQEEEGGEVNEENRSESEDVTNNSDTDIFANYESKQDAKLDNLSLASGMTHLTALVGQDSSAPSPMKKIPIRKKPIAPPKLVKKIKPTVNKPPKRGPPPKKPPVQKKKKPMNVKKFAALDFGQSKETPEANDPSNAVTTREKIAEKPTKAVRNTDRGVNLDSIQIEHEDGWNIAGDLDDLQIQESEEEEEKENIDDDDIGDLDLGGGWGDENQLGEAEDNEDLGLEGEDGWEEDNIIGDSWGGMNEEPQMEENDEKETGFGGSSWGFANAKPKKISKKKKKISKIKPMKFSNFDAEGPKAVVNTESRTEYDESQEMTAGTSGKDRDTERKTAKKKKFNTQDVDNFDIDTNTPNSKKSKQKTKKLKISVKSRKKITKNIFKRTKVVRKNDKKSLKVKKGFPDKM